MNEDPNSWIFLPMKVERQKKAHYCWASVTQAVLSLVQNNVILSQEEIATEMLGEDNNKFVKIGDVLEKYGLMRQRLEMPVEWTRLCDEIKNGMPVVARVDWIFGGGHVVVITGCDARGNIRIQDPLYGLCDTTYDDFKENYLNFGVWSHSYLIRV